MQYTRKFVTCGVAMLTAMATLCLGVASAQDTPDPAGFWDVEVDMGGTPMAAKLEIKNNGDGSFAGNLKSMLGDMSLEKVDYTPGESLTFSESIGEGDTAMEFAFEGKFTGADSFEGVLTSSMGEMGVKGTRGSPPPSPISGIWNVVSDSQLGTLERDLIVYRSGPVKYVGEEASYDVTDLSVEGNAVEFDVTVDAQGQELALHFQGTYEGDALTGEFLMDGSSVAEVTGTKSDAGSIDDIAGAWSLSADTPLGELAAQLAFSKEAASTMTTSDGASELQNVDIDADFVSFGALVLFEGAEYDVVFEGHLNGDSLDGDFVMDGSPVATVSAQRD